VYDLNKEKIYQHISIADNGIGFEQENNKKVFEIFQRLHGRHEYSGTGIGLAICKKIVENHGGVITAEGEPGKGVTIHIYLPVI
jgi:signal transduction histidine kinase